MVMDEECRRRLREEDLAFFGRIGADVSHEMRNVLSVIGEYAGFLDDLLGLSRGKKGRVDVEKLKQLSAKVIGQVKKGTEAMERFSSFAHAADEPISSFDLVASTANLVSLAQRQVKLAGCRLEVDLPDQGLAIRANRFALQHAVFSAIQLVLESLKAGEVVAIRLLLQGREAAICVSGAVPEGGDGDQLAGRISRLSAAMEELKGRVEVSSGDGMLTLTLQVPLD